MKKFYLLITLLLLISSSSIKAQFSIGLEAGYNKNYIYSSTASRPYTKYEPVDAFQIGIPVKYDVNSWFAIQTDPQYIRKSYKLARTGILTGFYQINQNNYLKLPVMAHFLFGTKKWNGFLNLGGYAAYWASGRKKGVQYDFFAPDEDGKSIAEGSGIAYNEKYSFDSRRDRRLELGLLAGVGLGYRLNSRYSLFAETRYYYSLSDQQKDYMINQIPRYNETYAIQFGCMYSVSK